MTPPANLYPLLLPTRVLPLTQPHGNRHESSFSPKVGHPNSSTELGDNPIRLVVARGARSMAPFPSHTRSRREKIPCVIHCTIEVIVLGTRLGLRLAPDEGDRTHVRTILHPHPVSSWSVLVRPCSMVVHTELRSQTRC